MVHQEHAGLLAEHISVDLHDSPFATLIAAVIYQNPRNRLRVALLLVALRLLVKKFSLFTLCTFISWLVPKRPRTCCQFG